MSVVERLVARASTPVGLKSAALFRVVAGATFLVQLAQWAPERRLLFGPGGLVSFDMACGIAPRFQLFCWSRSPVAFELLYFMAVAVVALWTFGYRTAWTTPLVWLAARSIHDRTPMIPDGGDNLFQILLVYACFAVLDAGGPRAPAIGPVRAILHNGAIFAMRFQVCVVYFFSGVAKLGGTLWPSGTALYYALAGNEHAVGAIPHLLARHTPILVALSLATVVFQVGFPFIVAAGGRMRIAFVAIALSFHAGIALAMGLVSFAGHMVAADLAILTDDEIDSIGKALRRIRERLRPGTLFIAGENQ